MKSCPVPKGKVENTNNLILSELENDSQTLSYFNLYHDVKTIIQKIKSHTYKYPFTDLDRDLKPIIALLNQVKLFGDSYITHEKYSLSNNDFFSLFTETIANQNVKMNLPETFGDLMDLVNIVTEDLKGLSDIFKKHGFEGLTEVEPISIQFLNALLEETKNRFS